MKSWLHTVTEKWHHPCIDWFPINITFTVLFILPPSHKRGARLPSRNQTRKRHCFPRSLSSGNGATTGLTVETLHCSGKGTPLREEAETVTRESDGNKSEQTSIHSTESAQVWCQSLSGMYVSKPLSQHWDLSVLGSNCDCCGCFCFGHHRGRFL